jgi:hypothetical protein
MLKLSIIMMIVPLQVQQTQQPGFSSQLTSQVRCNGMGDRCADNGHVA